jgi:quercetin dioxygenase-like cupin family protein
MKELTMITTVRAGDSRRTQTPNATMTTLASPTLGPTSGLSMWRVEMTAGAQGPRHAFDSEQLWTVLEGQVSVAVDDQTVDLAAGDTIVLAAGRERQISAATAVRLLVCGRGDAVALVPGEDAPRGTPPWIA